MRVAFFPDSFHEVNGVAHTARNFVAYAERHGRPMLCVRAGSRDEAVVEQGSVTTLELKRSRAAIAVEKDLSFDPLFGRHRTAIAAALRAFRPDVIHITGPSEMGIFGAWFAWRLGIPLAASWHTNVHEYAARRTEWVSRLVHGSSGWIEAGALNATARFYRLARVLFAPNAELCALLQHKTGKPCFLMQRGVDTQLFDPVRRSRGAQSAEDTVVLGYVGRLSVEKNVALLPLIHGELRRQGFARTRFRIVGHGAEETSLRRSLPNADFAGVLRGEALAEAYADMDLFVFPSETIGNVVLEALSSGVPAIVTEGGGPKFIVRDGETGLVRPPQEFAAGIASLLRDAPRLDAMRRDARAYALGCSLDAVFDRVYAGYDTMLAATSLPTTNAHGRTSDGSTHE